MPRLSEMNLEEVDTFRANVAVVNQPIIETLFTLVDFFRENTTDSTFSKAWRSASEHARKLRNEYLGKIGFCDLKVFEWISNHIPANSTLHLGNSTPVRYAQIFNDNYADNCGFLSNRGTSGIDGSTSTAVGYCLNATGTNILITGDLSFQYDSNAFFNKHANGYLKVIIINNSGGNIFRVIDGARQQKERSEFFETSTTHEFSNLAKHFNLNYFSARDEKELDEVWASFIKLNNRPSILEIFTDAEVSANTFKEFYKTLQ
jgi:2-succinyl-5-enolpyruvyl-6-hydroxy-3-cyclohexene-1-carboxylate synthase